MQSTLIWNPKTFVAIFNGHKLLKTGYSCRFRFLLTINKWRLSTARFYSHCCSYRTRLPVRRNTQMLSDVCTANTYTIIRPCLPPHKFLRWRTELPVPLGVQIKIVTIVSISFFFFRKRTVKLDTSLSFYRIFVYFMKTESLVACRVSGTHRSKNSQGSVLQNSSLCWKMLSMKTLIWLRKIIYIYLEHWTWTNEESSLGFKIGEWKRKGCWENWSVSIQNVLSYD